MTTRKDSKGRYTKKFDNWEAEQCQGTHRDFVEMSRQGYIPFKSWHKPRHLKKTHMKFDTNTGKLGKVETEYVNEMRAYAEERMWF